MLLLALVIATVVFALLPAESPPVPEKLGQVELKALPRQTERWLEAQHGWQFELDIATGQVTAWIDLDEGPRFCSNIVGCPIDKVHIGMPVQVVFEDTGQGVTLPKFRPAD